MRTMSSSPSPTKGKGFRRNTCPTSFVPSSPPRGTARDWDSRSPAAWWKRTAATSTSPAWWAKGRNSRSDYRLHLSRRKPRSTCYNKSRGSGFGQGTISSRAAAVFQNNGIRGCQKSRFHQVFGRGATFGGPFSSFFFLSFLDLHVVG